MLCKTERLIRASVGIVVMASTCAVCSLANAGDMKGDHKADAAESKTTRSRDAARSETAPSDVVDHSDVIRRGGQIFVPQTFETRDKLRINTGETVVGANGIEEARYVTRYPDEGNTFVQIRIGVASENPVEIRAHDIRLETVDTATADAAADAEPIYPLQWSVDRGLIEDHEVVHTLDGKSILNVIFEVPEFTWIDHVLFVGEDRVATLTEIEDRSASRKDLDDTESD